jgi:hypothetical protein
VADRQVALPCGRPRRDPTPGTPLSQAAVDGSPAQDFSFEDAGDWLMRIRSQAGNLYLSIDESSPGLAVRQDVAYRPAAGGAGPRPALQRFKITPVGISHLTHDHYVISNEAYPDLQLQPATATAPGSPVVLGPRHPGSGGSAHRLADQQPPPPLTPTGVLSEVRE